MDGSDSPIISIIFTKHQNQKVDMGRATKMTTDDFESVESLPDWAVPSFDCYLKYVCEGGLSTGEFMISSVEKTGFEVRKKLVPVLSILLSGVLIPASDRSLL